ncbi:MAG: glycoside hydrolase family 13 protein [Paludibacter sp.]
MQDKVLVDRFHNWYCETSSHKKWWKEGIVYQIYPRSFMDSNGDGIGDLGGIISKLDYLKELGVDVVWICPVYRSPNYDNGYDISDYYQIMDELGTFKDWEELLAELHGRKMKLIMDLVVNHTSDQHPWFLESRLSKDNPFRDYYIWRPGKEGKEPNNWASEFGGSAWEYDQSTNEYYLHLFSKRQPDLNWENKKLRHEIYKMMTWWLDKGIDGFRMDVINLISKDPALPDAPIQRNNPYQLGRDYYQNGPRIQYFLREMNKKVLCKYDVMTVGETPGVDPCEACLYVAEDRHELDMVFQFELLELDYGPKGKWDVIPWKLTDFKRILTDWQNKLQGGWNSLFLNNHDQPRAVSRFGNDTVYRVESAKMLATMLHTLQGTPYIYQGEEIGMTNVRYSDIKDYRDIDTLNMYEEELRENQDYDQVMQAIYVRGRDNARTPMQWEDSAQAGFTSGFPWIKVNPNYQEINVKKTLQDENSIFYYYKKLISLRKEHPVFVYGDYHLLFPENEQIFAYIRKLEQSRLLVILNFFADKAFFSVPKELVFHSVQLLISNYKLDEASDLQNIDLRPYEARVYLLN